MKYARLYCLYLHIYLLYTECAALYYLEYKLVLYLITDISRAASHIISEVHVMIQWRIFIQKSVQLLPFQQGKYHLLYCR